MADERISDLHRADWRGAFDFSGPGSSDRRAQNIDRIALFDLLCQGIELSEKEREQVKAIAQQLLVKIRDDLVIDWRKKQQAKARVRDHIQEVLDNLPESYDTDRWNNVFDAVYQHVYQAYRGRGESVYH